MKKIWRADWSCNKKDIFTLPLLMIACGIFGAIVVLVALVLDDTEDYVLMGTLMALVSYFLLMPAFFSANYSNWWHLSGSMGVTRKEFFFYMLLRQLVIAIASYGILLLLWQGEMRLYSSMRPGLPNLTDLQDLARFLPAAAIIGASVTLQMMLGALAVQFGPKGAGIFQAILGGILWVLMIFDEVRARFLAVSDSVWLVLSLIALAASIVTILKINRKMMVK